MRFTTILFALLYLSLVHAQSTAPAVSAPPPPPPPPPPAPSTSTPAATVAPAPAPTTAPASTTPPPVVAGPATAPHIVGAPPTYPPAVPSAPTPYTFYTTVNGQGIYMIGTFTPSYMATSAPPPVPSGTILPFSSWNGTFTRNAADGRPPAVAAALIVGGALGGLALFI
ncbi:hypothetical protein BOTBODRAFT_174872 [Botryobasidium botryosum FD-172 SS1]|uniref:Uncharacterized protein n=1 Tax=Botryobasidium botryosum (strain FD-172 SS1) TaxID=930990 RepID=A0A067MS60_BOTB1|nr:hypothetical protein BOTBODRAFT_174872 [Botryobasidium botryosum FD-172 SS1]